MDGKLSAEVLLGMLSEKGADVRSVVDQLMSTGQQGFLVEALKQQPRHRRDICCCPQPVHNCKVSVSLQCQYHHRHHMHIILGTIIIHS